MIYVRDGSSVLKTLSVNKNIISCSEDVAIHVPTRFMDRELGTIGTDTSALGIIPIIHRTTGRYTLLSINAIVSLFTPIASDIITIEDTEYYEFLYDKDDPIMDINVVRRDKIMYNIIDEFLLKAKVPWYMNYEDLAKFLDTAESHGGSKVAENLEVIELLVSIVGRHKHDLKKQIRYSNDKSEVNKDIAYVPLTSVMYSVRGTVNKLVGAYMDEGIVSGLVTKSTESSTIEKMLRE